MSTDQTVKVPEMSGSGHFTWVHISIAMLVAMFSGGFLNPVGKWLWTFTCVQFKRIFNLKDSKEKQKDSSTVVVAKLRHEEKTEDSLWKRIESLEAQFKEALQGRIDCEHRQNQLELQLSESKRERVFLLTEFISLKKASKKTELELIQVKDILRQHGWADEIIPPIKDMGTYEDEKILNEISIGYESVRQSEGQASA